ncbi:ABC1 kinase family protein [Georgenia sp. H159]|uniref:ABC1 kinase family protein n=1 Tax=Georgenia sp. H159 TaxID=3076115 RepID=UPI002D7917DA|nr:AarF/UbiB family protein [Georgenia sp. H159]
MEVITGGITILLLGFVTRRLLGVPVGWPRTIVVSLTVLSVMGGVGARLGNDLGWIDAQRQLTPGTDPLAMSLVYVLVMAWSVAVGLGVLVILEAMVPTGSLPSPVGVLRDLPARQRRSRRYVRIVAIAARHGLGGFLRARGPVRVGDDAPRVARSLRLAMSDAGVTFVKLGQMLSTRPDVVGPAFADELGRLTSQVAPQPWAEAERTLREELGAPPAEVFAHIDPEPLAAASVGQVHAARLHDGSSVVVKVQRSDARRQVTADLDIMRRLARQLERSTRWARSLRVVALTEGFAANLDEELDYRVEAENTEAVRRATTGTVQVPRVHHDLSGPRVLVMERARGRELSRAGTVLAGLAPPVRGELARALLAAVLRQMFGTGVFHADLHAGNVLLDDDGTLTLLDLGSVGRLDKVARTALGRMVLAVDRGDPVAATDALIDVLGRPHDLDDRELERELGILVVRYGSGPAGSTRLFGDLMSVVVRHGFAVPAQVAAAFRALAALEGTLRLLDPDVDVVGTTRALGEDLFGDRLEPAQLRAGLEEQLMRVLPVLERLPRRIDAIADAAQHGELRLGVRVLADPADRSFLTGIVSQLVMTLLAGAAAVCAVLLVLADGGPLLAEGVRLLPVLGVTLFLFAFVLAARALALAFRHTGEHEWGARPRP